MTDEGTVGRALVPCSSGGLEERQRRGNDDGMGWRSRSLAFLFVLGGVLFTDRWGELYVVLTCLMASFELLLQPESKSESSLPRESPPAPSRRGGQVHRVFGHPGRHGDNFGFFPLHGSCVNDLHPECALPTRRVIHPNPPAWSAGHRPVGKQNRLSVVGKAGSGA
jgi:hypothetical protein